MSDSNTHLQDEELILFHYRDGKDLSRVEEHLQSCSDCRIRFEKLDNLLGSMSVPANEMVAFTRLPPLGTETT